MATSGTEEQWDAVRASLRTTAGRFCELVSAVSDPDIRASAKWSVAEITAHVTSIAFIDTLLLEAAVPPFDMPDLTQAIATTRVDEVHGLNDRVMSNFRERDPGRLVQMLRDQVDLMLTASQSRDPGETFAWLGDSRLPLAGLLAHLVNELLIHGNDIARTVKVPWAMPPEDAALFFELFYVGLARGHIGRLLDGSRRPLDRRIAVELRSGYTTPVTIVVSNGRVTAEPLDSGADAMVRFDPATLNMMLFGRISRSRAILTGKLVIGGRRPWLLPAFLRTIRCPS